MRVRIEIWDWDFVALPKIILLSDLSGFRPHVDREGGICYFGEGRYFFSRNNPLGNLLSCLEGAAKELNKQRSDEYIRKESRYEFAQYWSADNQFALVSLTSEKKAVAKINICDTTIFNSRCYVISDDELITRKIYSSLIRKHRPEKQDPHHFCAWIIKLEQRPFLDRSGVPKNWLELHQWLRKFDTKAADRLRSLVDSEDFAKQLQNDRSHNNVESHEAIIIFQYEMDFFGIFSAIPQNIIHTRAITQLKRKSYPRLAQFLFENRNSPKIQTIQCDRCDESFIHNRNASSTQTLGGLVINLIGAGSVGGFLAKQLASLGAGSANGVFQIFDKDFLHTENIGRHLLGIDSMYLNKARALKEYLHNHFPLLNIKEYPENVLSYGESIFDCNILIDATGEEPLSLVLNETHQQRYANGLNNPPMFFTWVVGNGEAVEALLSDGGSHACYDCLNIPGRTGVDRKRFRILKENPRDNFIGCKTMRPYAVTAPTMAASLAAQMIMDWKAGNPKPRHRIIYLSHERHINQSGKDANPERLHNCSTCSLT